MVDRIWFRVVHWTKINNSYRFLKILLYAEAITVTNLLPNLYNLFKFLYGWFKSFLKSKQLPSEPLYYDIHDWQRQLDQIANLDLPWFNKGVHRLNQLSKRLILVFLHLCYHNWPIPMLDIKMLHWAIPIIQFHQHVMKFS